MSAGARGVGGREPSPWQQRLAVAGWEFRRFVKPKQLAVSLGITLVLGLVGYLFARAAERNARVSVEVAVVGAESLALASDSAVAFVKHPMPARDSLLDAVREREVDALLEVAGPERATLHMRRERPWRSTVEMRVSAARQAVRLEEAGLTPAQLTGLLAPVPLEVRLTDASRGGRTARVTAVIATGVVLYGLFIAMALMLVSVTAEKQLRVTEQLIAAIRPQEWIDGKIIGIAAVAMVNLGLMLLSGVVFLAGRAIATGTWSAPRVIGDPLLLGSTLLFALLGFAFWLTFFGAVAATIDDPNTSTRGPLMFVPTLFGASGFMVIGNPDSTFSRVLGLLPVTSSGAMPVRLASTDVPWWEVALSAALLVAGIFLLRRAAGRVFALGMLLTGKEPSWREVRRWMREA
jgi:ABC-2 type transport system permease protein